MFVINFSKLMQNICFNVVEQNIFLSCEFVKRNTFVNTQSAQMGSCLGSSGRIWRLKFQ